MEVILALFIFSLVATAFTKALGAVWRTTAYVNEELAITQILDTALTEALYLPNLEEGSTERFYAEREITVETRVQPLELENEEGAILPNMWEVIIIGRFVRDGERREQQIRGWRYQPLYQPV